MQQIGSGPTIGFARGSVAAWRESVGKRNLVSAGRCRSRASQRFFDYCCGASGGIGPT